MSYPPNGPPPPYFGPAGYWPPPMQYPGPPGHSGPAGYPGPPVYPHLSGNHPPGHPMPYFIPATMMVPMPIQGEQPQAQPTYITNYYYNGENQPQPDQSQDVKVVHSSGDLDWVPTTATLASSLTGRAVVGGHEGWDGSPLWVIRAHHNGDLVPGKLSVRHNAATIPYDGKDVPVQNIEVLCASVESLRWIPASNGSIPPSAIPGGNTSSGEPLYIGRAQYQLSLTPGKIHPSHGSCYISFTGSEVAVKMYDVLCRAS